MGSVITLSGILYYCKWVISLIYIEIYRYLHKKRFDFYDLNVTDDPEKTNTITPHQEYVFESPFHECHLLKAKDEIFFYGVNSKKECLIASISRMGNQKAEAHIYLKLESGKTYRLVRRIDTEQASVDGHVFSCGNLQLHYTNPMRRWRLFYNGFLRETDETNSASEKVVYVKFALIWRASSDVYDFSEDIDNRVLAQGLASVEWKGFSPPLSSFQKALDSYGQSGTINGTISVGDELQDHEIYLFGQRFRDLGSNLSYQDMEFHHLLGYTEKNGMFIHLRWFSASTSLKKSLSFGYVVRPDSSMKNITELSVKSGDLFLSTEVKSVKVEFNAEHSYVFNGVLHEPIEQEKTSDLIWTDAVFQMEFDLNLKKGQGIYIRSKLSDRENISNRKTSYTPLKSPLVVPRTVAFKDIACQMPEITGGKGSSLGKLTFISKDLQTFIVPEGIVVSTSSYEEILTQDIVSRIKTLEDVLYGNKDGDVKEACESVQEAISKIKFPHLVKLSIEKDLKRTFGEDISTFKFAVRSSATGEDTEQMSAAGQMDTFLGVSGLDQIVNAVTKCWASQFNFTAVQYKRRYGQCINSPMAVVIQKMVACDIAGVVFTCDPLTGNPALITITANYGLGESVVSGSEEPDTIILERDINDQLCVKNRDIGAKTNRTVMKEGEGTYEEVVPDNQKSICCLNDEMALRLGYLAIKIEKCYRSTRDIEWGFHNNNLYIFQSRPVTSGTSETTFEIDHELDGPLRVENDYFSTANVREGMPGAVTPLGYQVNFRAFMNYRNREKQNDFQSEVPSKYYYTGFLTFHYHTIFNVADVFHNLNGDDFDNSTQALLIAFFGRIPNDQELFEVVKERYGKDKQPSSWNVLSPFINVYCFFKNLVSNLRTSHQVLMATLKTYEGYRIPVEKCSSSKELFDLLLLKTADFNGITMCHITCSQTSSLCNMSVLSTISKEHGGFDSTVYGDFANLLQTSGDVESADVPAAIQSLALSISQAMDPEVFKSKTVEEALNWLQTTPSAAGTKFRAFLEKHGHRCLKELDLYSTTWGSDPKPLVKLLQNLSGNVSMDILEKKSKSQKKPELQVKMSLISKLKLKFFLYRSRRAVQDREHSKSLSMKVTDAFRKGYKELAKRMVSEGRIPEKDLLFFMTIEEIRDLLETRSPKILARASQRQRRFPTLDKYIFPEMMKGMPRPINEVDEPVIPTADNFSMQGIPVSQGIAKGYVRKAIRLEEAVDLKPGEILLTHSTDIGWTPYFPTLAGVVTELGGLISHGAVVSREFGIPCIAGLHGGTRHFQTGDYVLLDGNKGVLQKITPP